MLSQQQQLVHQLQHSSPEENSATARLLRAEGIKNRITQNVGRKWIDSQDLAHIASGFRQRYRYYVFIFVDIQTAKEMLKNLNINNNNHIKKERYI